MTLEVYDAMRRGMESGEPYPDAAGPAAGGPEGGASGEGVRAGAIGLEAAALAGCAAPHVCVSSQRMG